MPECDNGILCDICETWIKIGDYPYCPHGRMHIGPSPGGNPQENAVVYVSDQEGKVQYPGRTDVPIPERLQKRGYVKRSIAPSEMGRFEKQHGVMNERRHYDRNGRYD